MAKNGRKLYPEACDKTVVICGGYADELCNILVRLNRKMLEQALAYGDARRHTIDNISLSM
jgi:hypothetical protein